MKFYQNNSKGNACPLLQKLQMMDRFDEEDFFLESNHAPNSYITAIYVE